MARLNQPRTYDTVRTHEGAKAYPHLKPIQQLRRSVASCLLWEDEFYEDGQKIADRIYQTALTVAPADLAALAIEAREQFNLRHVPLLLLHALAQTAKGTPLAGDTIARVIQRADELTEFLAIYWRNGKKPLAKQVKRGLAVAFSKFDEYRLAKYNRDGAIKLRDVLFLIHAKPKDEAQADLWKRLVENKLFIPDTWETELSAGKDKKETFERLIREGKLGYLALLRNLRNMAQAGCDPVLVKNAIIARRGGAERVLPFRYVAAARAAPQFEPALDQAMSESFGQMQRLAGKTVAIIDVSGSMHNRLSEKSEMTRMDAACALGAFLREICDDPRIYVTAGNDRRRIHATAPIPPRQGMALIDAMQHMRAQIGGGGIFTQQCLDWVKEREKDADRIICITDEQDCSGYGNSPSQAKPFGKENYLINVASYNRSINFGQWVQINGFSESVLRFIGEHERE